MAVPQPQEVLAARTARVTTSGASGGVAGWPRRCFERLGDEGTRGIAGMSWSCLSSCCSATQTSKAMSGPPCGKGAVKEKGCEVHE